MSSLILPRKSLIRHRLEVWEAEQPTFLWIPDSPTHILQDQVGGVVGRLLDGSPITNGGFLNPTLRGPQGIRFPTKGVTNIAAGNSWLITVLASVPTASANSGMILKIGSDTDGIGFGLGDTSADTTGAKLIGLKEGRAWTQPTAGLTDVGTGLTIFNFRFYSGSLGPDVYSYDRVGNIKTYNLLNYPAASPIEASAELYIGGYTAASIYPRGTNAVVHAVAIYNRSFTETQANNAIAKLAAPFNGLIGTPHDALRQEFYPRKQVLYFDVGGGGAANLIIADATHTHTADALTLTSQHALTVQDATHSQTADNLSLTTSTILVLAEALHSHTADNLTLTLSGSESLAISDATHGHSADNLSLTTLSVLFVAEALHSHFADNLTLSTTGSASLVVADATHAHSADNLSLTSQLALSIAEAAHAHMADGVVLTSQHVLAVADALHAHLADNIMLSDAPALNIADALHGHLAENLGLTTDSLLAIADAAHAHLADNVSLTSASVLAIAEAMHNHYADNLVLNFAAIVEVLNIVAKNAAFSRAPAKSGKFSQSPSKTVEF